MKRRSHLLFIPVVAVLFAAGARADTITAMMYHGAQVGIDGSNANGAIWGTGVDTGASPLPEVVDGVTTSKTVGEGNPTPDTLTFVVTTDGTATIPDRSFQFDVVVTSFQYDDSAGTTTTTNLRNAAVDSTLAGEDRNSSDTGQSLGAAGGDVNDFEFFRMTVQNVVILDGGAPLNIDGIVQTRHGNMVDSNLDGNGDPFDPAIAPDIVTAYVAGTTSVGTTVLANLDNTDVIGPSYYQIMTFEPTISVDIAGSSGKYDTRGIAVQFSEVEAPDTFPLTITPNAGTPGHYDFEWASLDGKLYDLVSSTDLSIAPDTWPVWEGQADIPGVAPTNMLEGIPGGGNPARFFAVIEKDPPPPPAFYEEDFEEDNGGFTVATTQGSDWEWGDPDSTSPGGSVSTGNGPSTNCWGTNIGNPGAYADPTDTCLRSAVIDLTGVTAAELSFAQAIDLDSGDTLTVNIIDDTTDAPIATDIIPITDGDTGNADWEMVGPVVIPEAAIGQPVRIEWCLSGTGGIDDDYIGWYIDDVVVEDTSP